jgi:hypothetical protein
MAIAESFDELVRGWVCGNHARANECLRSLMPSDVAELALLLANADLDDNGLDTILADELDAHATRLEAFLETHSLPDGVARGSRSQSTHSEVGEPHAASAVDHARAR